jgi:uncharacterized protein (TIGR03435 family)
MVSLCKYEPIGDFDDSAQIVHSGGGSCTSGLWPGQAGPVDVRGGVGEAVQTRHARGGIKALPGGQEYSAVGAPVKLMIALMYKIPMRQIEGGPDWLNSDLWDVKAKADRSYSLDDLHLMFQSLLADEFKLKFHKESKEGNVYVLSVDKAGLKMKANDSPQDFEIPVKGGQDGTTLGKRVPMEYLCWWLGQVLQRDERPVIDRTGLKGNYDFTLAFLPELPPNFPRENLPPGMLDRPSIFDAVKQQPGLRLDAQKGPVEYYVIDHAERPSEN